MMNKEIDKEILEIKARMDRACRSIEALEETLSDDRMRLALLLLSEEEKLMLIAQKFEIIVQGNERNWSGIVQYILTDCKTGKTVREFWA